MHIHPGQVGGPVSDAVVDLCCGGRPTLGPSRVIPAVSEQDSGCARGGLAKHPKAGGEAVGGREVQTRQRKTRRCQMHMSVDERGRDPGTAQAHGRVDLIGVELRP